MVALVDLVAVGLLVEGLDVALSDHTLGQEGLASQSLVALLHGVLAGNKRENSLELAGQTDVPVLGLVLGALHHQGHGVHLLVEAQLDLDLLLAGLGRGDPGDVLEQSGLQAGVGGLGHAVDLLGQLLAVGDVELGGVNSSGLLQLLAAGPQLLQGNLGVLLLNLLLLFLILISDSSDLLSQSLFLLGFGLTLLGLLGVLAVLPLAVRDLAVAVNVDVVLLAGLTEPELVLVLEVGLRKSYIVR